jgi:acyl carrier protein
MITENNYPTADAALIAGLRTWLTHRVAYYVERESGDIDADAPVASYGLDSVYAFALCGDIEDEFKLRIEPTLVWDYATVAALAAKLASELPGELPGELAIALSGERA